MEENQNKKSEIKKQESKKAEIGAKTKKKKAKVAIITLSTIVVLFVSLQVYASVNGYGNVFFMIKNLITTGNPAGVIEGKDEIFSDKDITLSYKSIDLTDNLKIQFNRIEIKDGKTKIYIAVKPNAVEKVPLKYTVSTVNQNEVEIIGTTSQESPAAEYQDVLELNYEVKEKDIISIIIKNNQNELLRTIEINLETKEIIVKGEKTFEKISEIELKKYLDVFSDLNNGAGEADKLLYMASRIENNYADFMSKEAYEAAKKTMTDREFKTLIIKDFYGNKAIFEKKEAKNLNKVDVEIEVLKGLQGWEYDKENDAYKAITAGEDYHYGKCLKIKDISFENDIYTVKYVYMLLTDNELMEANINNNLEELPQYETTIKLKRDDKNIYSKYTVVNIEKGKEIKDKVSTNVNDTTQDDIFQEASKLQYTSNYEDSINGRIAFIKNGEREIKTEQKDGYYVYKTGFGDQAYNIKKITNVDSEYIMTYNNYDIALFRCVVTYIDNNGNTSSFEAAVELPKDFNGAYIWGDYLTYTGSTRFTKMTGLRNEDSVEENNTANNTVNTNNTTSTSSLREEYITTTTWKEMWPNMLGMKFRCPQNFIYTNLVDKDGKNYTRVNGAINVELSGKGIINVPVIMFLYTENVNYSDANELLEMDNYERTIRSLDNRGWTDWKPLKEKYYMQHPDDYYRREYGRVRDGDQIQKVIFDLKTPGVGEDHYTFIRNVLESISSTSV